MANISLAKASNYFVPQIEDQFEKSQLAMTDYQKMCVTASMQQIYQLMVDNDIDANAINNDINNILLTVAALQLNANAEPREIYFQTRNRKDKKNNWTKTIEMGIEGDGNDALVNRFGRNVAYMHPFWLVRKGDKFEEPKHRGIEIVPPVWEPAGDSDQPVVKVVYPIDMYKGMDRGDGSERPTTTEYFITDREQVKSNLLAHMSNNVMREKDKAVRMEKIKAFAKDHTLDEMLDSTDMINLGKISPAWREPQSRETMIIRKMRNNIVKKIPKDFNNGLVQMKYEEVVNDNHRKMVEEVSEEANSVDFDHALENHRPEPTQESPETASQDVPTSEPEIIDKPEADTQPDPEQVPNKPQTETEADPF